MLVATSIMNRSSTYHRPEFNYKDVEKVRPRNEIREVPPLALAVMLLSFIFVDVAAKLTVIFTSNPADCTVEVVMIAFAYQFVQYEVDTNDPSMIRAFIDFFRDTLTKYAPRYRDEDGEFINLNLGEIHDRLDDLAHSVHITAFATKSCLKKGGPKRTNRINRDNHSIWYHLGTTVADAFRSITNRNITEQSMEELLNDIAVVDSHTRCGTKGEGNSFPDLRDEVNEDPAMSAFCSRYESLLKLDESISIGDKKYTHCKPIIIDMLLGLFNLVLYALYYFAVTKTALCVFVSTVRSLIFFETVGGNKFNTLVGPMLIVGKGLHPNATEIYLTNRSIHDVRLMDEGMAHSLQHFDGRAINFVDDKKVVRSGQIQIGPSDAFERTYNYRGSKRRKELLSMHSKLMAELQRKHRQLHKKQGQLERMQEKLLSLNNRVLETRAKQRAKKQAMLDMHEKNRADAAARRKENQARQEKEFAEEANKRAKRTGFAFAALKELSNSK